jgi:RNA polymerase sigma-70 factor, ECF subfamily
MIMETFRTSDVIKDADVALVDAIKRGDQHAFEDLVSRHHKRVLAVAYRITNHREDAEDVAQECFQKVFLHIDDFQGKSLFATWLVRIAMNEAFMVLRRRRRFLAAPLDDPEEDGKSVLPESADHRPNPEQHCLRRERARLLAKAMDHLNPEIRTTIFLRDIEERSVQETAQILGTSVSAVKSRLFRGRRVLSGAVNRELLFTSPT